MNQPENKEQEPKRAAEELDLAGLFSFVGRIFKSIGNFLIDAILLVRNLVWRFRILIVLAVVVGGVIGFFSANLFKNYYRSAMVINSRYYGYRLLESTFDDLNKLAEDESWGLLAKELSLTADEAALIQKFEVEAFLTEEESADLNTSLEALNELDPTDPAVIALKNRLRGQNRNTFRIITDVSDPSLFNKLAPAVMARIARNEFIRKRVRIDTLQLRSLQIKLNQEQAELDSLKGLVEEYYASLASSINPGSNNVILDGNRVLNPLEVYKRSMKLYEDEQKVKEGLELRTDLELIKDYAVFEKPSNPSRVPSAINGMLYGFLVSLGIGLLLTINGALNQYAAKKEANKAQPTA